MKKTLIATLALVLSTQIFAQTKDSLANETSSVNTQMGVEQAMSSQLMKNKAAKALEVSNIKRDALVELASQYGTSLGLAWKLKKLRSEEIARMEPRLDRLYDFSKLAIDTGVLPPVIQEGLANYAQDSTDEVRVSDKKFRIVSNAKFVSVYPTWRNYLIFAAPSTEMPPPSLLPQTPAEAAIWDEWVKKGWDAGVAQGMSMFQASLDRIDRDYNGMLKFKQLLAQGVITATVVSRQNLGVTGGGRELAINDQIFRIVDHSALIGNPKEWKVDYPATYKNGQEYK